MDSITRFAGFLVDAYGGDYGLLWALVAWLVFLQMAALLFACILLLSAAFVVFAH